MASMRLIKPNQAYAGLPHGWWLKNYWEYVYPLILRAAREEQLPSPDENQAGPVIYAVGRYARAFAEPQTLVRLDKSKLDNKIQVERYQMTNTIHKGFVLPFVKFIALESDGDGSSFDELRNVAQSLSLDSDVNIRFTVHGGTLMEDEKGIKGEISIGTKDAMKYYCESYPIELPAQLYGQAGYTRTQTNKAVSSAYMAIFEPQEEEGTYRIDVTANYIFRFRGKSKVYGPLKHSYEIDVTSPIKKAYQHRK